MAESEPVTWRLAPGYLAAGKVNLLVGDEGIGKSLWTIRAIASITAGKMWGPFTIAGDPADVILIATEDGWSDTIRPRLEVADADLDRVYVFSQSTDGTGPPTFPKDMDVLRNQGIKPSLVVVDAWIDTVPGGLPVKDTQKARGAVAPWKSYAADTNAAVLLVAHTNRGDRDNLRNTYGLSVALRQVARSTLYAAEDHDTSALLVGPDKSNLGAGRWRNDSSGPRYNTSRRQIRMTAPCHAWTTSVRMAAQSLTRWPISSRKSNPNARRTPSTTGYVLPSPTGP